MNWLATIPTTNLRILATLVFTFATAVRYLVFGVPYRMTAQAIPVVDGWNSWLIFLCVMAGIDISQYLGKRFSDVDFTTARKANSGIPSVTVEAPAQVTVQQSAPTRPAAPIQPTSKLPQDEAGE